MATPIPDVKRDANALRDLLVGDPARANELIEWGKNCEIRTHPLHYVSDMLFDGTLQRGKEIPFIEALLEAGADPNYQARNGETPLMGAASLNAEEVGLWAACVQIDPRSTLVILYTIVRIVLA